MASYDFRGHRNRRPEVIVGCLLQGEAVHMPKDKHERDRELLATIYSWTRPICTTVSAQNIIPNRGNWANKTQIYRYT